MAALGNETDDRPTVRILGTHGVPANYGGFETAAENVAKYLVAHGWRVVVYCQGAGTGDMVEDVWEGIERVTIPVSAEGWLGTSSFDWLSIAHASKYRDDVCLTFGYNTAVFNIRQRLLGIRNVINMDGIEWSRARWGFARQAILYVNERIAAVVGNHLIADHPELKTYLATRAPLRKITTVTYGAHPVIDPDIRLLERHGLASGEYFTLIGRPIPENSILELVQGFSQRERGARLAVFGRYTPDVDEYHRAVMDAAGDEVDFVGGIYDPAEVQALRYYSRGYLHGHTVGGTNPSLVESLAAGNPVIAHDNKYNRWVAQDAALYFTTADEVSAHVDTILGDPAVGSALGAAALRRHELEFTWERVASQYEQLLRDQLPVAPSTTPLTRISRELT